MTSKNQMAMWYELASITSVSVGNQQKPTQWVSRWWDSNAVFQLCFTCWTILVYTQKSIKTTNNTTKISNNLREIETFRLSSVEYRTWRLKSQSSTGDWKRRICSKKLWLQVDCVVWEVFSTGMTITAVRRSCAELEHWEFRNDHRN